MAAKQPYTPPTVTRISMEDCEAHVAAEEQRVRKELITRMRRLSSRLQTEASMLGSDTDYSSNSLGVIQAAGSEIDRLCGEHARLRDFLKLLQGR